MHNHISSLNQSEGTNSSFPNRHNSNITEKDILCFFDTYFRNRNSEIKSQSMDIKIQEMLTVAKIICSSEFRNNFSSKEDIQRMSDLHQRIFEETYIMTPLNYNYWRDGILYDQLFPTTNQHEQPVCWAHAISSLIVLSMRRIIGRDAIDFEELKNSLIKDFGPTEQNVSVVLSKILPKYNNKVTNELYKKFSCLQFVEIHNENKIIPFNPYGSYLLYLLSFDLTGEKWNDFSIFCCNQNNYEKFLKPEDLCITKQDNKYRIYDGGHTVLLIGADNASFTCLNSWGKEWGNNGIFTIGRNSIPNMEFHSIFFYESDLSNDDRICYEKRRKDAIETFYHIIDNTNILPENIENDEIKKIVIEHKDEVIDEVKDILIDFCEDFWRTEKESVFRKQKLSFNMSINDFNQLQLTMQIKVLKHIINYFDGFRKEFFTKMKNLLEFLQDKNLTKLSIEISNDDNKNLIDIDNKQIIIFNSWTTEKICECDLINLNELIVLMNDFENIKFEFIYSNPVIHKNIYAEFKNIIGRFNNNLDIKIYFKNINYIDRTFFNDKNITEIELDSSVFEIGNDSFYGCSSLRDVKISSTVISIGKRAFCDCTSLKKIEIPKSVLYIGENAFYGCILLNEVKFLSDIALIKYCTFAKCCSLKNIVIPFHVKTIEDYAFVDCESLESVEFPSSLEEIGYNAFNGCSSLKNNSLPSTITFIGDVKNYAELYFEGKVYNSITNLPNNLSISFSSITHATIPQSAVLIPDNCFCYCSQLETIIFLDDSSLKSIGNSAFSLCTSLRQIKIPKTVKSIGNLAFNECSSLEKVIFEDNSSLSSIGEWAFYGCKSLERIEIPEMVESIGSFAFNGCEILMEVSIPISTLKFGRDAFQPITIIYRF